jgi:hypothetical protein
MIVVYVANNTELFLTNNNKVQYKCEKYIFEIHLKKKIYIYIYKLKGSLLVISLIMNYTLQELVFKRKYFPSIFRLCYKNSMKYYD